MQRKYGMLRSNKEILKQKRAADEKNNCEIYVIIM